MTINFLACRLTKSGNIILPKGRLAFAQHILKPGKPKTAPATQEAKYSTNVLIPKVADLKMLRDACLKVATENTGGKFPKGMHNPILEAKDYDYEGFTDQFWLVRPTGKQKPGLVSASNEHVSAENETNEVYSGRWACVSVRPFWFDVGTKKGVGLGLQNIQLLDHDEVMGGSRARAEDEFEAVEGTAPNAEGGGAGATEENPFG